MTEEPGSATRLGASKGVSYSPMRAGAVVDMSVIGPWPSSLDGGASFGRKGGSRSECLFRFCVVLCLLSLSLSPHNRVQPDFRVDTKYDDL